jgi:hypothetical protein
MIDIAHMCCTYCAEKKDIACRILIYWYPFGISKCEKGHKIKTDTNLFSDCFGLHKKRSMLGSSPTAEPLVALSSNAQQ